MKHYLKKILREFQLSKLNSKWRKQNSHNHSSIGRLCNIDCLKVGKETYGILNVSTFDHTPSDSVGLVIGNYCSIADNAQFLLAGEHDYRLLSTFPFERFMPENRVFACSMSKGKIVVEDDVWIGFGAIILSGVHIGQGAVVASGSVVTKDIPPYAVVGGVPAKVIKYRFSSDIIDALNRLDYSRITYDTVSKHSEIFNEPVTDIDNNRLRKFIDSNEIYGGTL